MSFSPKLLVVVGTPGSGKDLLIRAVNDLGLQHAQIVPKHTSRKREKDDGKEMICPDDEGYNLRGCDVIYENYETKYGIESRKIWKGLRHGIFQVVVVSNISAINHLRKIFGRLVALVYVHSEMDPQEYAQSERTKNKDTEYITKRQKQYRDAFEIYLENFLAFDHVFIYSGADEDLYDQIFRLFRAYEKGVL